MPRRDALDGLRVLDLTNLFAAPQIGATLADFGADVVTIEPPDGDPLRRLGGPDSAGSPQWALVSRNKRAIQLDLDSPAGRETFDALVARADVLIENLTATLLSRWGCEYERLAAINPRLVVVSVSCYGRVGPYADRPGAGTLAEAFAGFAHLNGEADGPPLVPSLPLGDTLVGLSGVIGTLTALYARDRAEAGSGRGQHVDVSMFEPILQLAALPLARMGVGEPSPRRMGSRVAGGVPRNVYRARDGDYLALSGTTDAQVARILDLLGVEEASERDRYETAAARLAVADELDQRVADWVGTRGRDEALESLRSIRIPAAPVNDLVAVLDDPHVRARASVDLLGDADLGEVRFVTPTPRLSETPGRHRHTGPPLGAHQAEVLADWLGQSD